jgi:hypothetical protein
MAGAHRGGVKSTIADDVEAVLVQTFFDEMGVFLDRKEFAVAAEQATIIVTERLQETKGRQFRGG